MTTTAVEPVHLPAEAPRRLERRRRASRRRTAAAGAALAFLCGALTVLVAAPALNNDPFRDEAVSAGFASRSLGQVWATILNTDACHAAYNLLMSALPLDFGNYVELRLVALVPVVLAGVIMTLWAAARLGTASALLVALSWPLLPATVGVGTYARDYGLVLLFAVVSSLLLVDLLAAPVGGERFGRWVGYAGAVVAMGLFGPLSLLLVPAQGLAVIVVASQGRRVLLRRWFFATCGAGVVLLAPMLLVARQPSPNFWVGRVVPSDLVTIPVRLLGGAAYGTDPAPAGAGLVTVVLLSLCGATVIGALLRWRRNAELDHRAVAVVVGSAWLVGPVLANLVVSQRDPIFVARYLWFVTPAAVLLLATLVGRPVIAGGTAVWRTRAWIYLPAVLVPALLLVLAAGPRSALVQGGATADYRAVVGALSAAAQPGDVIVVDDPPSNYARSGLFAAARGPLPAGDVLVERSAVAAHDISPQEYPPQQWAELLAGRDRVWVLAGTGSRPGPREKVAAKGRVLIEEEPFRGLTLRLYGSRPPAP